MVRLFCLRAQTEPYRRILMQKSKQYGERLAHVLVPHNWALLPCTRQCPELRKREGTPF